MNIVCIIGNVASAPVVRKSLGGTAVCAFRVAVARPGGMEADCFTVVTHDKQAEICGAHLSPGRRVSVEGRLRSGALSRAEADMPARAIVEITAHRVSLLAPPDGDADTARPDLDMASV